MTLDETIKSEKNIVEENQRIADTGIIDDNLTLAMLYCDDTEVIKEHLANYQMCAEEHKQIAEWLKELKRLREQLRWIPVSERLPEKDGVYLVIVENDDQIRYSKTIWYREHQSWLARQKVIAWMSLPEVYSEGENENEN